MRALSRAFVGVAMAAPFSLSAQGVQMVSVDRVQLAGALGKFVSFAARLGGAKMQDIADTMEVQGNRMRNSTGTNATIVDLDTGSVTSVDNEKKTYFTQTFAQMAAAMQAGMDRAKAEQASSPQQQGKTSADSKGSVDFKTSASFDRTTEHATIAGYDATRNFMTLSIAGTATPDDGSSSQAAGTMVFLVDEWRSTAAGAALAAQVATFQRAYAQKMGAVFQAPIKSLQAAFTQDPRIKAGMDSIGSAMQNAQGVALKTTTYVTIVPPGMTFDRALALGAAKDTAATPPPAEKKQGGLSGFMGRLKAAADAANQNQKPDTTQAKLQQSTLMTMTREVLSLQSAAIPDARFAPPAGYRNLRPNQ